MAFDLSNYKTVAERIAEARKEYPQGRFQSEIVHWDDRGVAVKARFFRHHDDPTPGEGMAWEPVPGKTPYTKDSELQNAETSAWGRALVAAFVVDASKGIASREEVQARQPQNRTRATERPLGSVTSAEDEVPALQQWIATQKQRLLDGFDGDKEQAKDHWTGLMASYGLHANQFPGPEMQQEIEDDITLLVAEMREPAVSPVP